MKLDQMQEQQTDAKCGEYAMGSVEPWNGYAVQRLSVRLLHKPVLPEYSYHMERISVRVSREPTSGINRQAVSYDGRCRRFRRADRVSARGVVDHVASDPSMSSCP